MRGTLQAQAILALSILAIAGCSISRELQIRSEPSAARVYVNGVEQGQTPFTGRLRWYEDTVHRIVVRAENYEPAQWAHGWTDAKEAVNPWEFNIILLKLAEPVDVRFDTVPSGATLYLDGNARGTCPAHVGILYSRSSSRSPWTTATVKVELDNYLPRTFALSYEEAQRGIEPIRLVEVRREVPVSIVTNPEDAEVTINNQIVGTAPLRHTFVFTRRDGNSRWSSFLVKVAKEDYHWRRPEGPISPEDPPSPFTTTLTLDEAMKGELRVELERIRFYRTWLRYYEFSGQGVALAERIVLSQVDEIETEPMVQSVTRMTDMEPDEFMLTRLWVAPPEQQLVYSIKFERPEFENPLMNLWRQIGQGVTRLTDGLTIDLEASVSADGQFYYFSANRLRPDKFNLWRIRTTGQGGFTKITDSASSVVDTYPMVSPDGSRIVYYSWLRHATAPHIWTANADGTLPTQLRVGVEPAWSPDSKKIVYVASDDSGRGRQVWVMNADGSKPTQLTFGEHHHAYPLWTPDGTRIIYASNEAINAEGVANFDIWRMNADGTDRTQLTVNGSYDSRPAVSPDGKYIYFMSNRGAKRELAEYWQIWRIELAGD
ncbi:MAG: PEGA domain-containing protein [Planctomycetes bacterium]|nr:PEGA domain-containing protein [Planctomycetota bacterium]